MVQEVVLALLALLMTCSKTSLFTICTKLSWEIPLWTKMLHCKLKALIISKCDSKIFATLHFVSAFIQQRLEYLCYMNNVKCFLAD